MVEKQAAPSSRPTSSATVVVDDAEPPSASTEKGDEKGSAGRDRAQDDNAAPKAAVDEREMKVAVRKHWCGSKSDLPSGG